VSVSGYAEGEFFFDFACNPGFAALLNGDDHSEEANPIGKLRRIWCHQDDLALLRKRRIEHRQNAHFATIAPQSVGESFVE